MCHAQACPRGDCGDTDPVSPATATVAAACIGCKCFPAARVEQDAQALAASELRYRRIVAAVTDYIYTVRVDMGRVVETTHGANCIAVTGYSTEEFAANPDLWIQMVAAEDRELVIGHARQILEGQNPGPIEHRIYRPDGSLRWVQNTAVPHYDPTGQLVAYDGLIRDVTERRLVEAELRRHALRDSLTGLPNRACLLDHLRAAIYRAQRQPEYRFAVLFLDFDGFKLVNDSLGHQVGDTLLVAVGQRLQACVRANDVVASATDADCVGRFGGDEFLILLDGIRNTEDAVRFAERLRVALAAPFDLHGHEVHLTASIGIVSSAGNYASPEDMIRDADTAMYRAKAAGKGHHAIFHRQMHEQVIARLKLESELRRAIERQEFHVVYQPIVSLETGWVGGFEALVRWDHPQRGLVLPDEFIPLAEETGLIVPIGNYVLETACRQLAEFERRFAHSPRLSMSVNISKRQLLEREMVDTVARVIESTGITPASLHLEVTESIIIEHAAELAPVLAGLKQTGVRLQMDDFGTGHSSLSRLHEFPIDCLKIDRAFVGNMGLHQADLNIEYTAVVQAIITLAHNLGMSVIAEGIETPDQLAQLLSLGCDWGQGYLFSRPLPARDAVEMVPRRSWRQVARPALTVHAAPFAEAVAAGMNGGGQ